MLFFAGEDGHAEGGNGHEGHSRGDDIIGAGGGVLLIVGLGGVLGGGDDDNGGGAFLLGRGGRIKERSLIKQRYLAVFT